MKLSLLILYAQLYLVVSNSFAQQGILLRDAYREDATQLAARLVQAGNPTEDIPTMLIDSIERLLWAVANHDHPKAVEISCKYNIHTFPTISTHQFAFFVEDQVSWANLLASSNRLEDSPLFEIVQVYDVKVSLEEYKHNLYKFNVHSKLPMNMEYFASQISQIQDILMTDVPAPTGLGNDIHLRRIGTGWILSYYLRFKDCPHHCKHQYCWQFGVSDSGEVKFLGEYGDVPPPDYELNSTHTPTATTRN